MRRFFMILCFCSALGNVFSAGTWNYRQCAEYALEHNLDLKDKQYELERQEYMYKNAMNNLLPYVDGGMSYGVNMGKTVDPNTNDVIETEFFSNSYRLSGNLTLFNGFRRVNQIKFEKYNLAVSQKIYEQKENQLVFEVMNAYTRYLLNAGLRDIQSQQLEMSRKEIQRIEKLIELGRSPVSDRYEAEARLAADEYLFTRYKNSTEESLLQLKTLMNYPADSALVPEALLYQQADFDTLAPGPLYQEAKGLLPGVQAMNNQLEAAKKQVQMMKGGLYPSLSFYSGYSTGIYETYKDEQGNTLSFQEQFERNRRIDYGISMYIPIFNSLQRRNQLQRAKVNEKKMENLLEKELKELEYNVNEAMLNWQAAVSEYKMAGKKEESQVMAFKTANKKWEKGLNSIMDFYESKNKLAEASGESLRTRLELFLREKTIQFYLTGTFL